MPLPTNLYQQALLHSDLIHDPTMISPWLSNMNNQFYGHTTTDSGFNDTVTNYPHIPPQPPPPTHPSPSSTYYPPHQPSFAYAQHASHQHQQITHTHHPHPDLSFYHSKHPAYYSPPQPPPTPYYYPNHNPHISRVQTHKTKDSSELPSFDGANPSSWLLEVGLYFLQNPYPWETRFQLLAQCMRGQALTWFEIVHDQIDSWEKFRDDFKWQFITNSVVFNSGNNRSKKSAAKPFTNLFQYANSVPTSSRAEKSHNSGFQTTSEVAFSTTSDQAIPQRVALCSGTLQTPDSLSEPVDISQDDPQIKSALVTSPDLVMEKSKVISAPTFTQVLSIPSQLRSDTIFPILDTVSQTAPQLLDQMHEKESEKKIVVANSENHVMTELREMDNKLFDPGIFNATFTLPDDDLSQCVLGNSQVVKSRRGKDLLLQKEVEALSTARSEDENNDDSSQISMLINSFPDSRVQSEHFLVQDKNSYSVVLAVTKHQEKSMKSSNQMIDKGLEIASLVDSHLDSSAQLVHFGYEDIPMDKTKGRSYKVSDQVISNSIPNTHNLFEKMPKRGNAQTHIDHNIADLLMELPFTSFLWWQFPHFMQLDPHCEALISGLLELSILQFDPGILVARFIFSLPMPQILGLIQKLFDSEITLITCGSVSNWLDYPTLYLTLHMGDFACSRSHTLEFMELKFGLSDADSSVQHGLSNSTFDPGILNAPYFQACGHYAMLHYLPTPIQRLSLPAKSESNGIVPKLNSEAKAEQETTQKADFVVEPMLVEELSTSYEILSTKVSLLPCAQSSIEELYNTGILVHGLFASLLIAPKFSEFIPTLELILEVFDPDVSMFEKYPKIDFHFNSLFTHLHLDEAIQLLLAYGDFFKHDMGDLSSYLRQDQLVYEIQHAPCITQYLHWYMRHAYSDPMLYVFVAGGLHPIEDIVLWHSTILKELSAIAVETRKIQQLASFIDLYGPILLPFDPGILATLDRTDSIFFCSLFHTKCYSQQCHLNSFATDRAHFYKTCGLPLIIRDFPHKHDPPDLLPCQSQLGHNFSSHEALIERWTALGLSFLHQLLANGLHYKLASTHLCKFRQLTFIRCFYCNKQETAEPSSLTYRTYWGDNCYSRGSLMEHWTYLLGFLVDRWDASPELSVTSQLNHGIVFPWDMVHHITCVALSLYHAPLSPPFSMLAISFIFSQVDGSLLTWIPHIAWLHLCWILGQLVWIHFFSSPSLRTRMLFEGMVMVEGSWAYKNWAKI